jgi:hypothetical protein
MPVSRYRYKCFDYTTDLMLEKLVPKARCSIESSKNTDKNIYCSSYPNIFTLLPIGVLHTAQFARDSTQVSQ